MTWDSRNYCPHLLRTHVIFTYIYTLRYMYVYYAFSDNVSNLRYCYLCVVYQKIRSYCNIRRVVYNDFLKRESSSQYKSVFPTRRQSIDLSSTFNTTQTGTSSGDDDFTMRDCTVILCLWMDNFFPSSSLFWKLFFIYIYSVYPVCVHIICQCVCVCVASVAGRSFHGI